MSVKNKPNGIHVMSVKSKPKINIVVNGAHVVSVESLIALRLFTVTVTAHQTLDTHDMNPIDSNVKFCFTLDTHDMNSINHNRD